MRDRTAAGGSRSLGGLLAATADLYRSFPLLFLILAVAVMAPYELAVLAITGYGPLQHGHENFEVSRLVAFLRISLVTPLISALHIHAVALIRDGQRPRLGRVALQGLRVLPVVVAAEIAANIGIALGFVALIIPGIVLSLRWAVVAQAAAVERQGWVDAVRSSAALTKGSYGRIFVLLLVVGVSGFAVYRGAWAIPLGSTSGVSSVAVGIAIDSVVASLAALIFAVLYFDLRAAPTEPLRAAREYQHLRDLD
jgi:hypothetical protein